MQAVINEAIYVKKKEIVQGFYLPADVKQLDYTSHIFLQAT
jgi:hypothetical protein